MSDVTWGELAGKYANAAVRAEVKYRGAKELYTEYDGDAVRARAEASMYAQLAAMAGYMEQRNRSRGPL